MLTYLSASGSGKKLAPALASAWRKNITVCMCHRQPRSQVVDYRAAGNEASITVCVCMCVCVCRGGGGGGGGGVTCISSLVVMGVLVRWERAAVSSSSTAALTRVQTLSCGREQLKQSTTIPSLLA